MSELRASERFGCVRVFSTLGVTLWKNTFYTVNTETMEGVPVVSTTFTMKIDDSQKALISEYAEVHGKSMAEFMIDATLDVIEDAMDLHDWNVAKAEFDKNPVTYSAVEVAEIYH